ncbi:hypothetical protein [Bacillus sp. V5-8f]|uniref:hypothetical protein n=1 Tax=Bacillus sp. V5-8f TaxID=2053044 RepID=UPI000C7626AB|nr:hypothetical protein [Bacillus sp. V5-8f]PLT33440.1 hypothetical protein CUU64_14240 [Bacillus sp. V5-8f]
MVYNNVNGFPLDPRGGISTNYNYNQVNSASLAPQEMNRQQQMNQDDDELRRRCQRYMNYSVTAHMQDGSRVEGILDNMDHTGVTMLVPEDEMANRTT